MTDPSRVQFTGNIGPAGPDGSWRYWVTRDGDTIHEADGFATYDAANAAMNAFFESAARDLSGEVQRMEWFNPDAEGQALALPCARCNHELLPMRYRAHVPPPEPGWVTFCPRCYQIQQFDDQLIPRALSRWSVLALPDSVRTTLADLMNDATEAPPVDLQPGK